VDDQTEYSDEAPAVKRPRADRTYVARLDFMTQMHLLRLDGARRDHVRPRAGDDHGGTETAGRRPRVRPRAEEDG